jgi:hypothetical protein
MKHVVVSGMDEIVPPGYFEFEMNPLILRYEDEYVIAWRDDEGIIRMRGKPLREVSISEEYSAK